MLKFLQQLSRLCLCLRILWMDTIHPSGMMCDVWWLIADSNAERLICGVMMMIQWKHENQNVQKSTIRKPAREYVEYKGWSEELLEEGERIRRGSNKKPGRMSALVWVKGKPLHNWGEGERQWQRGRERQKQPSQSGGLELKLKQSYFHNTSKSMLAWW